MPAAFATNTYTLPLTDWPVSATPPDRLADALTSNEKGDGPGGGGGVVLFATVSVPLRISVPPAVRSTAAVKVCTPSGIVAVLNATALPLEAVPAKSQGAMFSVLRAVPDALGLSR